MKLFQSRVARVVVNLTELIDSFDELHINIMPSHGTAGDSASLQPQGGKFGRTNCLHLRRELVPTSARIITFISGGNYYLGWGL